MIITIVILSIIIVLETLFCWALVSRSVSNSEGAEEIIKAQEKLIKEQEYLNKKCLDYIADLEKTIALSKFIIGEIPNNSSKN